MVRMTHPTEKDNIMELPKFSLGMGDRFTLQAQAQLTAIQLANKAGTDIAPVWNKSHREHTTIGTAPASQQQAANAAVKALGWDAPYFIDADHINLSNVDLFLDHCNYFTIDVADSIGQAASREEIDSFLANTQNYVGQLNIPGIDKSYEVTEGLIRQIAEKYLFAMKEAGEIYRHIAEKKGAENFVTEVSIDETDAPQTPLEIFFILAAIGQERIPVQTIAPKFTGRFNKGVDYVGDLKQFTREFEEDVAVLALAIKEFSLPENLKLSVHSGSDKFSIYALIKATLVKFDAGVHVKTAGTTWLEELIGLAAAEGEGLVIAKEVYASAYEKFDELCAPYAAVIDIDLSKLPTPEVVNGWSGQDYASALRHVQSESKYNPHFRQLLHVGYKIAAKMGERYLEALKTYESSVSSNVTENIFERHVKPIFLSRH
jgi:hypothetical protein